ncbi:MAG: hypothetical protein AB1418_00365 [Pseudomonadota bacterium]
MSSKPRISPAQAGLLLLCLAWLLPGLVGHAPWKGGDGDHFVQFLRMLQPGGWVPADGVPPLYYWTAAATAWLTSAFLPLHDGARLASGVFVALTLAFTLRTARAWYGPDAGWAAVLTLLGCLGLLVRGHELNAHTAQFAAAALMLYGLARLPAGPRGGAVFAAGTAFMLLAGGAAEALVFLLLAAAAPLLLDAHRSPAARRGLAVALAGSLVVAAAGWAAMAAQGGAPVAMFGLDRWLDAGTLRPAYYLGILGWFAWPAWPLALWALYRERRQWRTPGMLLPVLGLAGLLGLYAFVGSPGEERGLILLLPLALLGGAGLLTMRRGAANALLWFGVMLFGFIGLVFWVYWGAHDLGSPARLARRLVRLGMTDVGTLRPWALVLGALATLVWIGFLVRVRRSPLRPMLVWTVGLTFIWGLLMALFQGPLDRRISYASVAEALVARVPADACIQTHAVRSTQRHLLAYHSGRFLVPADVGCGWLLVETRQREAQPHVSDNWVKQWEGARPGDRSDRFHLYVRR